MRSSYRGPSLLFGLSVPGLVASVPAPAPSSNGSLPANPLQRPDPGTAATIAGAPEHCFDTQVTLDPACWEELQVGNYLNNWLPKVQCPAGTDQYSDKNCCLSTEPFTTCFIRLAQQTSGTDCTTIGSCQTYVPNMKVHPDIAGIAHYLIYTIYALNNFFTTWYYATVTASEQAGDYAGQIVELINPPKKTNVFLDNLLVALTATFAIVATPDVAIAAGITASTGLLAKSFATSLAQAPTVSRAMWPEGTDGSVTYQIAELQSSLGDVSTQLEAIINRGLAVVMSDLPSFEAFTANGTYSGQDRPALANETAGLQFGFTTYLSSLALTENAWEIIVTPARLNGDNQGTNSWNSTSGNGVAYLYENEQHPTNDPSVIQKIFDNGWSTASLMFDGALQCLEIGQNGTTQLVQLNPDSSLNYNCLPQTYLCKGPKEWFTGKDGVDVPCPLPKPDGSCWLDACDH